MKKVLTLIFVILFFCQHAAASEFQRIVSLKPNITSILFDLGVGDRIVGVTTFCDRPIEAKGIPRVADYTRPFLEKIISVRPDVIIGSKEESSQRSIFDIKKMGFRAELFDFGNIDQTISSIKGIADLLGVSARGDELASKMKENLISLEQRYEKNIGKKVIVVWSLRPIIVSGPKSYMSELLKYLNLENAVVKGGAYPHWGMEEIFGAMPDAIIDLSGGMGGSISKDWNKLKVYHFPTSDFSRMSPEIVSSMKKLGDAVHNNSRWKISPPL